MPETTSGGNATPAEEGGGGQKSIIYSVVQGLAIFGITQYVMNQFMGSKTATSSSPSAGQAATGEVPVAISKPDFNFDARPAVDTLKDYSAIPYSVAPLWPDNSILDIQIYVTPSQSLFSPSSLPKKSLVLDEKSIQMGNYKDTRTIETTINVPSEVQHNGTLWAHFLVSLTGHELDPFAKNYDPAKASHFIKPLNHYLPKKRTRIRKNLLAAKTDGTLDSTTTEEELVPEETTGPQIASYYHSNFSIVIVPGTGVQTWRSMHPALRKNINLEQTGARDASGQHGWYYPVIYLNTFWQLRSHMIELNDTVKTVPLNIQLYNMANWKYSILASMDEGMKQNSMQAASGSGMPAGGDGSELEKVKEILLDTNSYLLGITFFVSILHMVFEGLAFKNDISHWRKKKDNVGTSVRTIIANVFMQTIIFLYLVDNSDGTSWMILAGQGFGILLEAWKITKMVDVVLSPPGPDSNYKFLPYVIEFKDKHKLSETEQKTKEYDEIAFQYLYIIAIPLLGAYAVYSLVYETHKSWYSFVIETLVGSVYAYGFLMMVPSLYINYRLKSVAHMPSKTMTYKFLNTFIDDLFAFTIRMPTLHRLATLRDDVIFFVWLYQKYKYKVDYTRVNEFGQGGESDDEAEDTKADPDKKKKITDQDTKQVHPTAPVARASGAENKAGAKKRK